MEMHVQDFAKIMRRAHQKAFRQWRDAGPGDDGDFAAAAIVLSFIADAAEEVEREPCRKCGYPQVLPDCAFPGHIQCIKPLTENQEGKE